MHTKRPAKLFLSVLGFLLFLLLLKLYADKGLRYLLLYLSHATWARDLVTGFPLAWRVAGRFVAGETVADALQAAQGLQAQDMLVALDYLGESVHEQHEAEAARDHIIHLLEQIEAHNLASAAYVSVKLSQLGVKFDEQMAYRHLCDLLDTAQEKGTRIRIDMEESALVDTTLRMYHQLRDREGYQNVGVVIQSYLYRSEADVQALAESGSWVRLVKGAYMEPPDVAFPQKADTDANFVRLLHCLLSAESRRAGTHVAIATHDEAMIQAALDYVRVNHIPTEAFEFQMLFGIRRELQEALAAQGYPVRIYVPYGTAWYPYFMRRLAERPANLWFFVSNLLRG